MTEHPADPATANLAHEIRNALQRSQACLELLALEVQDRPQALDLVHRIQEAQDRLALLYGVPAANCVARTA